MNLTELQKEAHAIAKAKGWWDQERTIGDCIALVHSELSEALEAYRETGLYGYSLYAIHNNKPVRVVAVELADVVIRVADMAEGWGVELVVDPDPVAYVVAEMDSFGDWITLIHLHIALAGRCYCEEDEASWVEGMSIVVSLIQRMAAHYGIDLDAAIEAKMAWMRERR